MCGPHGFYYLLNLMITLRSKCNLKDLALSAGEINYTDYDLKCRPDESRTSYISSAPLNLYRHNTCQYMRH
jgi:hypothetical protein